MQLESGLKGVAEETVTENHTAAVLKSGSLPVYATPMMVALMEHAACIALEGHLDEGQSSVGIHMDVSHDAATPVGMKVHAEAEVTAVDGRKVSFLVKAFDEAGPIGSGTHERFVIDADRFLSKTQAKLTAK